VGYYSTKEYAYVSRIKPGFILQLGRFSKNIPPLAGFNLSVSYGWAGLDKISRLWRDSIRLRYAKRTYLIEGADWF